MAVALLRHEGTAQRAAARPAPCRPTGLAVDADHLRARRRRLAGERRHQLVLAVAGDAGDAEDLARAHREGDVLERRCRTAGVPQHRQALDDQPRLAARRLAAPRGGPQLGADHQLGHALRGLLARVAGGDHAPAAQDRRAVAERLDLLQLVAECRGSSSPRRRAAAASSNSFSTSCGVSTEVGSSMISSCGFCSRQRTISMRWRSPTERCAPRGRGRAAGRRSCRPRSMRAFSARRGDRVVDAERDVLGTVSASNSEKCWNTMPMPSLRAALGAAMSTGCPCQQDLALVGAAARRR